MSQQKLNKVSPNEAIEILTAIFLNSFKAGVAPPACMMHGAMGVAKSAVGRTVAKKLANEIGREVVMIDVRLGGMDSSEVNGIPHNVETGEVAEIELDNGQIVKIPAKKMFFSTPDFFPTNKEKYYILFLDELSNCNEATQHTAYRVTADRTIQNGSKLPDTCAILGAGNRRGDKTGAKRLLPALANRFACHLDFDDDRLHASFLQYMIENDFHRSIIGYLNWRPANVYANPGDVNEFATLRTWEFADGHMKNEMIPEQYLDTILAGCIGTDIAVDFAGFREYDGDLPDFKAIRAGQSSYTIRAGDEGLKHAIASSLAMEFLDAFAEGAEESEINNLADLMDQLPRELKTVMFRTMKASPALAVKLVKYKRMVAAQADISQSLK